MAATTTTKPPAPAAELSWVEGLIALRERLEERTRPQEGVALTQAKMRECIAAGRSCTPSLAKLGTPSPRLQGAHRTAEAGCRLYERSAEAWVDTGDWMAVGDVDEIQKSLNAASEHGGNAHNRLLVAERQAARARTKRSDDATAVYLVVNHARERLGLTTGSTDCNHKPLHSA